MQCILVLKNVSAFKLTVHEFKRRIANRFSFISLQENFFFDHMSVKLNRIYCNFCKIL